MINKKINLGIRGTGKAKFCVDFHAPARVDYFIQAVVRYIEIGSEEIEYITEELEECLYIPIEGKHCLLHILQLLCK